MPEARETRRQIDLRLESQECGRQSGIRETVPDLAVPRRFEACFRLWLGTSLAPQSVRRVVVACLSGAALRSP